MSVNLLLPIYPSFSLLPVDIFCVSVNFMTHTLPLYLTKDSWLLDFYADGLIKKG